MDTQATLDRRTVRALFAAMALGTLGLHCSSNGHSGLTSDAGQGDGRACGAGETCGPCADASCPRDGGTDAGHALDAGSHDAPAKGDAPVSKDAAPADGGVPIVPAFYVSTTGSDTNPGTLTAPFATLGKAQMAMQSSATLKTTYVRAGSYMLPTIADCGGSSCGLLLTGADDGETWSYYPPDGVDSADLSGGSTSSGTGLVIAIYVGANDVTIDGLSIHDFQYAGVNSGGGTGNLTVENSVIFNGYVASGSSNPAGISCYGCSNATISHNVIHDIAMFGVSMSNVNGDISNLLVTGNVVYNTCTAIADCGALYVQDVTATATNLRFTNNYIHDGNTFATLGSGYGSALYADDCTSNVTETGNVLTGRNGANTSMVHGGSNVHQTGNLTDLAGFQQHVATFQTSGASGVCERDDERERIREQHRDRRGRRRRLFAPQRDTEERADDRGQRLLQLRRDRQSASAGAYSDSDPVTEDPELSGWAYDIASTSPVFKAPVDFVALVGGWGPPGYVLPETGTAPSSPH